MNSSFIDRPVSVLDTASVDAARASWGQELERKQRSGRTEDADQQLLCVRYCLLYRLLGLGHLRLNPNQINP